MKKNIVKMVLTTALVATAIIGSNKLEAKAYNMSGDVANMTMVEYSTLQASGKLPKAAKYVCSVNTPEDENALLNMFTSRGLDANVELTSSNIAVGDAVDSTVTDTTVVANVGVGTVGADMITLVNADRAANGAGALIWNEDLAVYAAQRVVEVAANYNSAEYQQARGTGNTAAIAHRGLRSDCGENATFNPNGLSSSEHANTRWINSASHHNNRLDVEYTQYAAAYYVDPVTGATTWVELFQY